MNSERWQQLDKLFHATLEQAPEQRSAFLRDACAGDDSLRKDLEVLLAAHHEADQFMVSSALEFEAESLANDQNDSIVGQKIGHYKILSLIGEGGMGAVYLAHDARLGRKVALKLLPPAYTNDKDRVRRFQLEARAASALNHPNIVTIYEIGQVDGKHFIATEFIDGETLGQRIKNLKARIGSSASGAPEVPFKIEQVLNIGTQVADALSAAHSKQIIHRDIKPDNILLTRDAHLLQQDDHVKLLDFGIAKLSEQAATSDTDLTTKLLNTREGMVIGTASYMSPEQARGERVDSRTDVWSLGVVLYEMLTQGLPFGGDTAQDVIASILKEEPPPLPPAVPEKLSWIVEKALRKDREARYQTAREMFFDLRTVQTNQTGRLVSTEPEVLTTQSDGAVPHSRPQHRRLFFFALPILMVASLLVIGIYKFGPTLFRATNSKEPESPASFKNIKLQRLTNTGKVTEAAISPDGKYVVHLVADGEQQSLWMKQVSSPDTGVRLNAPADLAILGLTFSPNGDDLYVHAWDKKNPFSLSDVAARRRYHKADLGHR